MAGLLRALEGGFTPPKSGNDPVRNPDAVPTGGNFYGLAPDRLPTRAAWALGQEAARGIIEERRRQSGKYPEKVAVVLWAVESLRNEGLNEATIMALIGVEPVWHASGRVLGTRPIPAIRLGRPRIDVAIDMSGLYRDLFPEKALMLDAAIRQAALQDDADNLIRRNDARIRQALLAAGYSEAEADRLSRARIFSEAPGAYGNRVEELASASGLWEDDSALSEVFRTHTSFAYGSGSWGEPAPEALDANLEDAEVAWHSVSSTLYGVMDNDDMYMYLGGLSLAIRSLSGRAPTALIADQRQAGEVRMESLQGFIGREMRSRYLNPKWIEGMKAENYAGAREMSNYVEYLWGWQATTPESVDRSVWDQTYEVYVEDKYDLGIKRFLGEHNPWAFQSITARLLESARKGYWEADQAVLENLAREYVLNVLEKGLACCDHTCNNPMFHQMVMNLISIPGVMPMELAADFKLAVEKAAQKSLEDQVSERERLLEDLGRRPPRPDSEAGAAEAESRETVRGLKMEPIEAPDERAELSSSGVQWLATVAVLAIVALFLLGLRSRRGRD
jgi:cobaltochelatase CobN